MLRKVLRHILKLLSRWSIKKHGMKIIVVAGIHGTKLTGEILGQMMLSEYVVRWQLERPFWDFSIPLSILGEEDVHHTSAQWLLLLIRNILRLAFGRRNFTWTILQMNTFKKDIASYWLDILKPEISILVNADLKLRYLEKLLCSNTKDIVVLPSNAAGSLNLSDKAGRKVVTVGNEKIANFQIVDFSESENGTAMDVKIRNLNQTDSVRSFRFYALQRGEFMYMPIAMSCATLASLGIKTRKIQDSLIRTEIEVERFIQRVS
ncbi:hypothetical protein JW710_01545 [Candidatus Dojkabacteria bacterium]|nr:hypothetical protein [Candidatus Dojkabacteria bacterium]